MAANDIGTKRVIRQEQSYSKHEPYFTPVNNELSVDGLSDPNGRSRPSNYDSQVIHSADASQPSARRIVVVRNPKQPNVHQQLQSNINDLLRPNSATLLPSETQTPQKTVYVIRRPIPSTSGLPQSAKKDLQHLSNVIIIDQTHKPKVRSPILLQDEPPSKIETPIPPAEETNETNDPHKKPLTVHFRRPSPPYKRIDDDTPRETTKKQVPFRKGKTAGVQISPPRSPVDERPAYVKQQKVTFVDDDRIKSDHMNSSRSATLVNPEE
ncbi:unnamed protein product, partial [Didymodactylos carnosus]